MVTQLNALNPAVLENIRAAITQEQHIRLAADAINYEADAARETALATALFGDRSIKLATQPMPHICCAIQRVGQHKCVALS